MHNDHLNLSMLILLALLEQNLLFLLLRLYCLIIELMIVELNLMGDFLYIIYDLFLMLLEEELKIVLSLDLLFVEEAFEEVIEEELFVLVVEGFLGKELELEVGLLMLDLMEHLWNLIGFGILVLMVLGEILFLMMICDDDDEMIYDDDESNEDDVNYIIVI